MEIEQREVGFMAVFCYVVACPDTKEAMVIDPAGDEEAIVQSAEDRGLALKYIVNTHGHADHTCGNGRVQELTGAKIIMHTLDEQMFNTPEGHAMARQWGFALSPPADILVEDGDRITIGHVSLEVIHTPGHSPGGICLYAPGHVFTGDTLFVSGIGRTDLPGASMHQFMKAIKERLMTLPGDTVVWPGHNYGPRPSSTIEIEKQTNPWFLVRRTSVRLRATPGSP
jgi:glyoxylase-like metal-dependent hydrolase (beta-lactamase superfamily II)